MPPNAEQCVLTNVLGLVGVADHGAGYGQRRAHVSPDQHTERSVITRLGGYDKNGV